MFNLIAAAFITGLTTGGLSCLAVQGGLLASSLAGQIEKEVGAFSRSGAHGKAGSPGAGGGLALPIAAFLVAKLAAYTLLGFLLGAAGQVFQLSPYTRAFLQIAIGIFMLGTALRMLNVHPIFRYFAFEPPAFLRRRLRKKAAEGSQESSLAAPLLLGLLTVLIPCGVTQAMMAAALGTGSPAQGAVLMFAFTLGTSPVFFAGAYSAFRLGKRLERHFVRFTAAVLIVLALVTVNSGLTLAGSPLSFSSLTGRIFAGPPSGSTPSAGQGISARAQAAPAVTAVPQAQGAAAGKGENVVTVNATDTGYSPEVVHARAGVPVQLRLVTNNTRSCSRAFVIPSLGVQKLLAATGEALVDIPAQKQGTQIPFSCSMGMYGGTILFDL